MCCLRAETLFAVQSQRLDRAGDGLGKALGINLQKHSAAFHRKAALLRPRILQDRIALGRERSRTLFERITRAEKASLAEAGKHLQGLSRVLESVSHKSALERGFALVRGENGVVRRAAAVKPGEALTLTFADGDRAVTADGASFTKASGSKARRSRLPLLIV